MTDANTIHRTDPHLIRANADKEQAARDLLRAWRRAATATAADQWVRFHKNGETAFRRNLSAQQEAAVPPLHAAKAELGAARMQMVRYQAVGTLRSYIENRANDFRDIVERSTLDDETRHQLHIVNRTRMWFHVHAPVVMRETGEEIPTGVRRLARAIMRHVLKRHRRPSFRRCNAVIDRRGATLAPARDATAFPLWVRLSTLETGRRIELPLARNPHHEARCGERCATVQLNERADGRLTVGVVTDVTEAFAETRTAYTPLRDVLALDFGLETLIATNEGDLLGRGFLRQLEKYDRRITTIARHRQRAGLRPRDSERYRRYVAKLQGFVRTEISRILNRLVLTKRPEHIVVERLDFRMPGLSRRLNRILTRCGRKVVREKLQDLEERYGVTHAEINPAYTSQECDACGYVSRSNRPDRATFRCERCGYTCHADVGAARVLRERRSHPDLADPRRSPRRVLDGLRTRGHTVGRAGGRAMPSPGERQPSPSRRRRSPQKGWRGDLIADDAGGSGSALRAGKHPQHVVGFRLSQ